MPSGKTADEIYDGIMAGAADRDRKRRAADGRSAHDGKKASGAAGRKGSAVATGLREVLIQEASGATSFADLNAARALRVKVDALYQRIDDLSELIEGIFYNELVTDKAAALRALLAEFAGVVDGVLAEAYRGTR